MADQVNAVVFKYAGEARAAVPPHASIAILEAADMMEVPAAPAYCNQLLRWQGRTLPVLDLGVLLGVASPAPSRSERYVLVVAYQDGKHAPIEYGALKLDGLPVTVAVTDEMACPLPDDSARWPEISLSCFRDLDQPVPILDTARLFSAPHP